MTLSSSGFGLGSYETIKLLSEDVGNLQSIKLINKGRDEYRCNTIKIESESNYWYFECDKFLKCPHHCSIELPVVNMIKYDITIKTSSMEDSGTSLEVYIVIWGTNGKTPQKLLSNKGFATGSLDQLSLESADVGDIYGVTLYLNGNDKWRPEEVIVKKPSSSGSMQEKVFRNTQNSVIVSWEKSLTIKLPSPESNTDEPIDLRNPNSLLDNNDQQKVIQLGCKDTLKGNDNFGPSYVTSNVNYMMFLVECRSDCIREKVRAVGMGIHPEESPICINALVDRAVSFYGGIIAISVFMGLPSYTGGKKM